MILSSRHLPEDDLALFALQLLEGEELEQALEHLEHCEDCRHDVARFQGDLVGYALAMSDMHTPPSQARERLLKRVAKEKKIVPVERPRAVESAQRERVGRREQPRIEDSPSRSGIPVAQAPQQERPLQQMAERLAEHTSASGRVPIAQPMNDVVDERLIDARGVMRAADADRERELFLASRGRRMFESSVPVSEDESEEHEAPRGARGLLIAMSVTGWAIAACMAVMAGMQYRQRLNVEGDNATLAAKLDRADEVSAQAQAKLDTLVSPNAMQVSMGELVGKTAPPKKPEGHVAYMADKGALVMIADHLNPLPAGKTYELWLLPPEDANGHAGNPVPAGTFKPDVRGIAEVILPAMPKGIAAHGFGVTVENDGGSDHPSSSIILYGTS